MSKIPYALRAAVVPLMLIIGNRFAQTPKTASGTAAGQTWEIPFASADNTISLSIQNNSTLEAKSLSALRYQDTSPRITGNILRPGN